MDKIRELLEFESISATDEQINEAIARRDLDPDAITDEDAVLIIGDLKEPRARLAVANGNAKSAEKGKAKSRKNAKTVSLQEAIVHAAKETESELSMLESTIREHKGKYVAARAKSLLNEIRNTGTEIVEAVTDTLMQEEADIDSFREIGDQLGAKLFPTLD